MTTATLQAALDYAGVATFAASSALVSRRHQADLTASVLLACVAAIGGGTIRDLLIARPVFWVTDPLYVVSCVMTALLVWLLGANKDGARVVAVLEAIGIGSYAVVGAQKAQIAGLGLLGSIIMGTITATFGGLVSDSLADRKSVLARKEIFVTAALLAATTYRLLEAAGVSTFWALSAGAACGIILRLGGVILGWAMPAPP